MARSAAAPAAPAGGPPVPDAGVVTPALERFARRYPAMGRTAVSVICAAAGPLAAPPQGVAAAAVLAAGVVVWNLAYLAALLPDRSPARLRWIYATDLALLCGLCLAQPLIVEPGRLAASLGWVSPMASFTVVAVQFQLPGRAAAAATVAVFVAFVAGTAATPGLTATDGLLLASGAWMLVEAVLARLLWRLLCRGARDADRLLQERFAAERAAATAAARRADQRAHWATVHDTSASTLLMIGLGQVTGTEAWLPGQVDRDIALLDGRLDGGAGEVDLAGPLGAVASRARVRVDVDCPAGTRAPAPVAAALAGAVAEALENVHRHAGTGTARLVVARARGSVEVVVADAGRGFDPAAVGPHRFGLAWSVHDRMDAVGGRAAVESAPHRGTVVRLRWPG